MAAVPPGPPAGRHELEVRVDVCQAAVDRFKGQTLAYGRADCVRLAAFVLRRLGHKVNLAAGGSYTSMRGARVALARAGYDSLEAALDGQGLPRIAPARVLPADLLAFPGVGMAALKVSIGQGLVLGFKEDPAEGQVRCDVLEPTWAAGAAPLAAWRVFALKPGT